MANTYLRLEFRIVNDDGSDVPAGTKVAPVNNTVWSLFSGVDLLLNNDMITSLETTFPWWTYVYQLLFLPNKEREGWKQDDDMFFDLIDDMNKGFGLRQFDFSSSKKVRFFVPLLLNRYFTKPLPPQTSLTLRFNRAPTTLTLMAAEDKYDIEITDARLYVSRVKLNSPIPSAYDLQTIKTHTRAVGKGDRNIEWDAFQGILPKRVYIFQVTQDAFNGGITKNPYNFNASKMNRLQVFKNGVSLPLNQGFEGMVDDNYQLLYQFTRMSVNCSKGFEIGSASYPYGLFVACLDLTNDFNANESDYRNPGTSGNLRVVIDYKEPLAEAQVLFCVGEFDETLRLDGRRLILEQ